MLKWDEALQIEAGKGLNEALEKGVLDAEFLDDAFRKTIDVLKIWSSQVTQQWIKVFNSLVRVLPAHVLSKDCIELTIQLGEISQPLSSRVASAHLIGSLTAHIDKKDLIGRLIPKAKRLC